MANIPESLCCHGYTGKRGDKLTLGQELHLVAPPAATFLSKGSPFESVTRQVDDKCLHNSVPSSVDR
jgi:hypothetical protein